MKRDLINGLLDALEVYQEINSIEVRTDNISEYEHYRVIIHAYQLSPFALLAIGNSMVNLLARDNTLDARFDVCDDGEFFVSVFDKVIEKPSEEPKVC